MTGPGPAGKPAARGWSARSTGAAADLCRAAGLRGGTRLAVARVPAIGIRQEG